MQKITSLLFALCFVTVVYGQSPCLPNGIIFSSAQEIADFESNYPGCTEIIGDVYIATSGADLHGLDSIRSIGGFLRIGDFNSNPNFTLGSLQGLNHLRTVGGGFFLENNPSLSDLQGLDSLRAIGGDLRIWRNNFLSNLSGPVHLDSIGGYLSIKFNENLQDLSGLNGLNTLGQYLLIDNNLFLHNLDGLEQLFSVGGNITLRQNGGLGNIHGLSGLSDFHQKLTIQQNTALTSLDGLQNLADTLQSILLDGNNSLQNIDSLSRVVRITDTLSISGSPALKNLRGLQGLTGVGRQLDLIGNHSLKDLTGLDSLRTVGLTFQITSNDSLINLQGLNALESVENMIVLSNYALGTLTGLEQAQFSSLNISSNFTLTSLAALKSVHTLPLGLTLDSNIALPSLSGLDSLESAGEVVITNDLALKDLSGLTNLRRVHRFIVNHMGSNFNTLHGLENLAVVEDNLQLVMTNLNDISALANLDSVANLYIVANPNLHACAVAPVCALLAAHPDQVTLIANGTGCSTKQEVKIECDSRPLVVRVLIDRNHDCMGDAGDLPAESVEVQLNTANQQALRATRPDGSVYFSFLDTGLLRLSLPHFPDAIWQVCQDTLSILPAPGADTVYATLLLNSPTECPQLTVDLGLPAFFRGCLVQSEVQVNVRNPGSGGAENVLVGVVLPAALNLVSSAPPLLTQAGDTLFFAIDSLNPLHNRTVNMVVQTDCNADLVNRTLCLEAFVQLDNPCANTLPAFSEIRLSSQCLGDTTVRFTLKNIGDAPTIGQHVYTIFRNAEILQTPSFSLTAHQSLFVDLPANGATYRLEATKLDGGTLTATAIEGCGGFTPGQITAFWIDEGLRDYDFDCREVRVAYDPNEKTAVPTGAGFAHVLPANRTLRYTVDFQNTGTDTAFRVLLRDVLSPQLNAGTFRPAAASHPYTWQILNDNTLEVLFQPIMLPDSNVNEAASHGWFSFDIDQRPDLPDGTTIMNTASIIFDYNSPIVTNTVLHNIGQLMVRVDEPQPAGQSWQVLGNPAREAAIFRSRIFIAGAKRFELTDALGRIVRTEHFDGQEFEFHRGLLGSGLYYFRICDVYGKAVTGKIVLSE